MQMTHSVQALDHVGGTLVKYASMYGMTRAELATALGMSRQTLLLKLQDSGRWTLFELRLAVKRFDIPWEELLTQEAKKRA